MPDLPRPRNVAEVELWLRQYYDDLGRLETDGYASAPDGSKVQSTRQGRPTEQAAVALITLPARVGVVETWLSTLNPTDRKLADWYLFGSRRVQIHELAEQYGWSLTGTWRRVRRVPQYIWDERYAPLDNTAENWQNKG